MSRVPFGVLISGSGTNLQALIDAAASPDYPGRLAVVVSNRRDALGLERARSAGIPARWIPHRKKAREDFEREVLDVLDEHDVEWVALAGFMRMLTPTFLDAFPGRLLNIHPSLLPAFPGLNGPRQALERGVRIAGATVHFVIPEMDAGPILLQGAVPVLDGDTEADLKERILSVEHRIYPRALALALSGQAQLEGQRVRLPDDQPGWLWDAGGGGGRPVRGGGPESRP
ncbi:MAG: phosphoribosylglycinamide formyltransferase [Myxococcota bacterium]